MPCAKKPPTPGCLGPGTPKPCAFCKPLKATVPVAAVASAAATRARQQDLVFTRAHSGTVTQDNVTFNGSWNVSFKFSFKPRTPHLVQVTVNVFATGGGLTAEDQTNWKTYIDSGWSGKFKFVDPAPRSDRWWEVRFDTAFGNTPGAYQVNVQAAAGALPAGLSAAQENLAKTSLPEGAAIRRQIASHRDAGTLNMGVWARGDAQAFLHEFGHMIGCPDEYTLKSVSSNPAGYALPYSNVYDVPGYSTDSVMNNPDSTSRVYERHLHYVCRAFEPWSPCPEKPAYLANVLQIARM